MERSLLLHERYEGLTSLRDEEGLLLCPLFRELGSPHSFEVGSISEHQLCGLRDAILGYQVFDVVLGYLTNPVVNVRASSTRILTEVL